MTSIFSQKTAVEREQNAMLYVRDEWEPIALDWFTKWKMYVDVEIGFSPRDELHPGPIDNSSLQGKFDDELRPGLVEGVDFVLLKKTSANVLFNSYTGGPRYTRHVINNGTAFAPIYQVSLYRVRVEAYRCDSDNANPDFDDSSRILVRYFEKTTSYKSVVEAMMTGFDIQIYANAVRCWIKEDAESSTEESAVTMTSTTLLRDSPSSSDSEVLTDTITRAEGMGNKRARVGRLLTAEVTDRAGPWKFVREDFECSIREVLGTSDCVRLIIEVAPVRKPSALDWPRRILLEGWKDDLRVGDTFDACDRQERKWYSAVAKEIAENGDISVHFKGWAAQFDEVISASSISEAIQPLYAKTVDRREWAVGDSVDYRVTAPDAPKAVWIKATIHAVDPANDRVEVSYSTEEKDQALKKFSGVVTLPAIDDDVVKKRGGAVSDARTIWCDILGEDICPANTHTKKITGPKTTNFGTTSPCSGESVGSSLSSAFSYVTKPFSQRHDYSEKHIKGATEVAGAVGLQNLGNTCFMNSILQCVSNTDEITKLFLNDTYQSQINTDNPLGHGGKLANAYARLVKDMWNHAYCKIIPREFKHTIGEFQPQFAGYDQQDSQEFLGFLLDGLHEDLNRVQKKPHVTKIESKGRADQVISSESWRRYLLRNDSELVERCFGQLKSHVTCTNCGNESVTFDEYSSLSLPLPIRNTRTVSVIVQLLPLGSQPVKVDLEFELHTSMQQLQKLLVEKLAEHKALTIGHTHSSFVSTGLTSAEGSLGEAADPGSSSSCDYSVTSMEVEDTTSAVSKTSSPHATTDEGFDTFEMVSRPVVRDGIAALKLPVEADSAYVTEFDEAKMEDSHTSLSASPVPFSDDCTFSDRPLPTTALEVDSNAMGSAAATHPSSPAGPFFHFGTLFSCRPSSVFKHYNSAEQGNTAVTGFVGKNDALMAFQLEHWSPEHRSPSSYSYSYHRSSTPQYDATDASCGYVAVDLCFGKKVTLTYSNTERIELGGYPYQLALAKDCTNRQVFEKVRLLSRRFFKEDSQYCTAPLDELPYSIIVTNSYGSITRRTVPLDDAVFEPPAGGSEILVVLWPSSNLDAHIEEDQLEVVRNLEDNPLSPRKPAGGPLSIYQCFDKFSEREQLAEAETLYCSRCKQHLAPIKKMDVWAAPDVLIIQLKRFQYVPGQYFVHREKIGDVVDFPIEGLDLSRYVIGPQNPDAPPVYDLYAVSHHMGGLGGGHYTATCKNHLNNNWYDFNDSMVSRTTPEKAVTGSAYVLFYKRRKGAVKWAGIVPSPVPLPDE